MNQQDPNRLKYAWLLIAAALLFVLFLFFVQPKQQAEKTNISVVPVVIYAQEISAVRDGRSWPTVRILRKIGNAESETLAEVGKVGEFPIDYQLSPDKKFLLVNLESKLQILDLASKELKDLFVPKRRVQSVSYSPDGNQLFIWDQKYVFGNRNNDNYYIHRFTISDRRDEIIKQGVSKPKFYGEVWRTDGKIILYKAKSESFTPYYFDLADNQIVKTPGLGDDVPGGGLLSESGQVMAIVKDWTGDICDAFTGAAPEDYDIIDPVSGKILGTVGSPNDSVTILAFSPDDTEVFYQIEKPWINQRDCGKPAQKFYFKTKIATGEVTLISRPAEFLRSWSKSYVGVVIDYDYENRIWSVLVNGQSIATSSERARPVIAGQYYQ